MKMQKKILITGIVLSVLAVVFCIGMSVNKEYEAKTYVSKKEFKTSSADSKVLEDEPEISTKLKKGCVVVNVKTVCDKQYQKLHKDDWKVRAKKVTKKGTKALYSEFNIYFKPKKAVSYTSKKSSNEETLLKDFVKKNKISGSVDMIVGLSGREPKGVAGITYLGKVSGGPKVLIFATTYNSEAETIQHEIGHTYDLDHCKKKCVMTASGFGYLNKFCTKHKKQWKANRKYY